MLIDVEVERRVIIDVSVGQVDEVVDVGPHVVFKLNVVIEAFAVVLEVIAWQAADEAAITHVFLRSPLQQINIAFLPSR